MKGQRWLAEGGRSGVVGWAYPTGRGLYVLDPGPGRTRNTQRGWVAVRAGVVTMVHHCKYSALAAWSRRLARIGIGQGQ